MHHTTWMAVVAGCDALRWRWPAACRRRLAAPPPERGQATAEYALVLLGAAAIALLLAAWAARSGAIGRMFDAVVDQLIDRAR